MKIKKPLATLVACILAGAIGIAVAGLISKPNTFTAGTLAKSSEVNSNFDTIYNEFNGNISDANISASAAIQQSKISTLVADLAARLLDTGDTITGELKSKYSTPCYRLTGTEGSAKDWTICESAGSIVVRENTGTEGSPTWTTRYTAAAGGTPSASTDLTPKSYVDGLTSGLGFGSTVKTDGNFSTASTTYTDVTGLSVTVATGAHRARVNVVLSGITHSSNNIESQYLLVVDGVATAASVKVQNAFLDQEVNASFSFVTDVLTAASHTFKIQAKTASGTVTIAAVSATPAIIQVEELPL